MNKLFFIVEGDVAEPNIIKNINEVILKEHNSLAIVSYGNNIYNLYKKVSLDDDLEIIEVLNTLNNTTYDPDDFTDIYLFFDYDGHDPCASECSLLEMIRFFKESTGAGKLYLNYPMVESLKHIEPGKENDFTNIIYEINKGSCYKRKVESEGCSKYNNVTIYTFDIWKELLNCNLKRLNYIINGDFKSITHSQLKEIDSLDVYLNQKSKYIDSNNEVVILNSFPIFIGQYINNQFFLKLTS